MDDDVERAARKVRDVERLAADMHRLIDAHVAAARDHRYAGERRHERLKRALAGIVLAEAERQGWPLGREQVLELFALDIELNAQGLAIWLDSASR